MKCPYCSAEVRGEVCEYCGSAMPKEKATVNITNNYFGGTSGEREESRSVAHCPMCGNCHVVFKRERTSTATKSDSRKNLLGFGRNRRSVSRANYHTVGVCQSCGYTWNPNTAKAASDNKTWLWVLGWICIFPVPLTILMLRKKEMKPAIKYGIIAGAWLLYLLIGFFGGEEAEALNSSEGVQENGGVVSSSVAEPLRVDYRREAVQ